MEHPCISLQEGLKKGEFSKAKDRGGNCFQDQESRVGRAAWEELQAHLVSLLLGTPDAPWTGSQGRGPPGVSPRGQLLGAEQGSAGEPAAAQHT